MGTRQEKSARRVGKGNNIGERSREEGNKKFEKEEKFKSGY